MQMIHDEVYGVYPHSYMQFRPALSRLPMIYNVTGDCVVGNGSGSGRDAMLSAMGEYTERYHFYNEVDINLTADLQRFNSQTAADKLINLILQVRQTDEPIIPHQFDLTETCNIFTLDKVYLPTVMVSLSHADSADRKFIPFIDSCGQAVQISQPLAFAASLKEFIERQALVGAWISGEAKNEIKIEKQDLPAECNKILSELYRHGELIIYELNKYLPGYSVIIFYFARDKNDIVKYSVGMAADFSPLAAINRALNELWQSYIFMYLNADNPENLDQRYQYLNDLISFNHRKTKQMIPFINKPIPEIELQEFLSYPSCSIESIMNSLQTISSDIYAYERSNNLFGRRFHYCKIISPDFFLHMGIMMPLNLDNAYAKLLGIEPGIVIKNPIPFP